MRQPVVPAVPAPPPLELKPAAPRHAPAPLEPELGPRPVGGWAEAKPNASATIAPPPMIGPIQAPATAVPKETARQPPVATCKRARCGPAERSRARSAGPTGDRAVLRAVRRDCGGDRRAQTRHADGARSARTGCARVERERAADNCGDRRTCLTRLARSTSRVRHRVRGPGGAVPRPHHTGRVCTNPACARPRAHERDARRPQDPPSSADADRSFVDEEDRQGCAPR